MRFNCRLLYLHVDEEDAGYTRAARCVEERSRRKCRRSSGYKASRAADRWEKSVGPILTYTGARTVGPKAIVDVREVAARETII